MTLGKDTPENRQIVLNMLHNGTPLTVIVKAIGVHRNTLLAWRKKDPMFDLQCQAMQARDINECLATIKERSKVDWKAAAYRVERSPLTRDEFGQMQAKTHINTIKIGHLIQRDPNHVIPRIPEDDEEPDDEVELRQIEHQRPEDVAPLAEQQQIECREPVEAVPLVESIQEQVKPIRSGSERCPGCGQVPQPVFKHQCLGKRGLPV